MAVFGTKPPPKPHRWSWSPGLIDPRWRWVLEDLVALVPFWEGGGDPHDLIERAIPSTATFAGWGPQRDGVALDAGTTSTDIIIIPNQRIGVATTKMSALWVAICDDSGGGTFDQPRRTFVWGSSEDGDFLLGYNDFNNALALRTITGSGEVNSAGADTSAAAGSLQCAAGTYDGATQRLYQSGIQIDSDAQTGNLTGAEDQYRITNRAVTANRHFDGKLLVLYVWLRTLTPKEIYTLSTDPFGPLRMSTQVLARAPDVLVTVPLTMAPYLPTGVR